MVDFYKLLAAKKANIMNLNDSTVNSTIAILDASLDDMADLPQWVTFPPGVYKIKPSVKIEQKVNAKTKVKETLITIGAKLLEVRELNTPDTPKDKVPEIGAETSCRFTWDNEFGQGALKNLLKPIAAITGQTKVTDLLETLDKADSVLMVMDVRTTSREGKPDAEYQSFIDLIVE